MNLTIIHKEKKLSVFTRIQQKILFHFRLNHHPVIWVYNGYGSTKKIIVFGHVLKLSPYMRKTYRQNWIVNTFSMLRLFMVKPFSNAKVSMEWEGVTLYSQSQQDGFFKFEIPVTSALQAGWHEVVIHLEEEKYAVQKISGVGKLNIPFQSKYVFVSDIDDTFLVSYSSKLRKRLYVLLTKNARSRKPFDGVIKHYRLLASSGHSETASSPFFYVSSSEWNLFYYIEEFSKQNRLPAGVFLLNELKKFNEVWRTGQNKHATKFFRIVRLMEAFPERQFVLFGDDSQEDPNIYQALTEHFKNKIFAIYIRKVQKNKYEAVQQLLNTITSSGIHCCYFTHSAEAIIHSKSIGLII